MEAPVMRPTVTLKGLNTCIFRDSIPDLDQHPQGTRAAYADIQFQILSIDIGLCSPDVCRRSAIRLVACRLNLLTSKLCCMMHPVMQTLQPPEKSAAGEWLQWPGYRQSFSLYTANHRVFWTTSLTPREHSESDWQRVPLPFKGRWIRGRSKTISAQRVAAFNLLPLSNTGK